MIDLENLVQQFRNLGISISSDEEFERYSLYACPAWDDPQEASGVTIIIMMAAHSIDLMIRFLILISL